MLEISIKDGKIAPLYIIPGINISGISPLNLSKKAKYILNTNIKVSHSKKNAILRLLVALITAHS